LIEWPDDESEPTKYWFSTLPENISFRPVVDLAKLRWRIERDYQELKPGIMKGAVGAASITTPRYASPPTVS
jgi:SRSO17 transposase